MTQLFRFPWLGLILICLGLAGCGGAAAVSQKEASAKRAEKSAEGAATLPPAKAAPVEKELTFASVEEALKMAASTSADESASNQRVQADKWIEKQGAKGIPVLSAKLLDKSTDLSMRMAASRILAKLGAEARPALFEVAKSDTGRIRARAIESLGKLKPPDKATVELVISLIDDPEVDLRKAALKSLAHYGKNGQAAAPRLLEILNDQKESEAIRDLAKAALKVVDQRKGLMNVK